MNRYLTEKTEKMRWWHVPVALLSTMMTAAAIQVWVEDRDIGDPVIRLLAHITVTGLMAWPLIHVARCWWWRREARKIAGRLARRPEASLPLADLDRALGVKNAAKRIRRLTEKGYLQLVGVDEDAQRLWLSKPETVVVKEAPEEAGEDCDDVLRSIRKLNDDIADEAVSEKIERIEAVTASIFRAVEERPERAESARRFMNYYLPTTLRLLESYRLMEGQSYQGENIQAARHRIEEVLDKLVSATEQQQDKLFSAEALDVDAEILVLETMMASDGLTQVRGMGQG